ncbi:MAG: CHAT domain-containing protein [Candidatus Latescibacteria bacterium]|nr:CHAT domain-containing protein [Candidatus Latescibacterota bacterium]
MQWLDIDLTRGQDATTRRGLLDRAHAQHDRLVRLQQAEGLDSSAVHASLTELGQLLFRAAQTGNPAAFAPDRTDLGAASPSLTGAATESPIGYHLIVATDDLVLPWTCLHNGIRFVLELAPICADRRSSVKSARRGDWSRRWEDQIQAEQSRGPSRLGEVVRRFRPEDCADPGVLFLDGHGRGDGTVQAKLERAMLDEALAQLGDGQRLAWLETPAGAMTPGRLVRTGRRYQGFHFSGATAAPQQTAATAQLSGWEALARDLMMSAEEEQDLEPVGVDPVTALLDRISERAEQGRLHPWSGGAGTRTQSGTGERWLLEDGPVAPEDLARQAATPPLVFSNSYLGLTAFGPRFLMSGASAVVGPHLAVSQPRACAFAGDFYRTLAGGATVASALRTAALACRDRSGADDPAWLSYGMLGSGALALQYL